MPADDCRDRFSCSRGCCPPFPARPPRTGRRRPTSPGRCCNRMLAGDLHGIDEIVFAVRVPGRDHWYVNFGYYSCDYGPPRDQNFGLYPDGEGAARLRRRRPAVPAEPADRPAARPAGRPAGRRPRSAGPLRRAEDPVLVPPRRHAHVITCTRSTSTAAGLRQLTDGPDDDIEPTYLPGRRHRVRLQPLPAVRQLLVQPRGHAVPLRRRRREHPHAVQQQRPRQHALGAARRPRALHALGIRRPHPGPLPSPVDDEPGRHRPDDLLRQPASAASPCWTPSRSPARNKVVASFSPGHGMPEHTGHVAIVDPTDGPGRPAARSRRSAGGTPSTAIPTPCPRTASWSPAAQGLHVMDGQGNVELIYQLPKSEPAAGVPRAAAAAGPAARTRHPVARGHRPSRPAGWSWPNIYHGRNMAGVKPGEIKKLLVLEQLPKPVNFSGGMESISIGGTFTLARILGTVPVEPDGSADLRSAGPAVAVLRGPGRERPVGQADAELRARCSRARSAAASAATSSGPRRCPQAELRRALARTAAGRPASSRSPTCLRPLRLPARHPADPRPALRRVPQPGPLRRPRGPDRRPHAAVLR